MEIDANTGSKPNAEFLPNSTYIMNQTAAGNNSNTDNGCGFVFTNNHFTLIFAVILILTLHEIF